MLARCIFITVNNRYRTRRRKILKTKSFNRPREDHDALFCLIEWAFFPVDRYDDSLRLCCSLFMFWSLICLWNLIFVWTFLHETSRWTNSWRPAKFDLTQFHRKCDFFLICRLPRRNYNCVSLTHLQRNYGNERHRCIREIHWSLCS